MKIRFLRLGVVALSLAPLFAACGSDSEEFKTEGGDAGEGGEVPTPTAGKGGSGGSMVSQGGAGGAPPVEEGGAGGALDAGGAAGAGGEGGTPIVCLDKDLDGVTDCDGDCKDTKATVFPGNPEICGDGYDNDCANGVDDPCGGLGTYVSALKGDDLNPGTALSPVKTIAQGIANAVAIEATTMAPIEVYVAEGDYPEKVTMVDGVSLLGGYACNDTACDWSHDPSLYVSAIQNQDHEGVVADHAVFSATKLDGFSIQGWSGDTTADYPGTCGVIVKGGSPTISNNKITAGDSTTTTAWTDARSVGVCVLSPTNDPLGVIIDANTIEGKASLLTSAGILFDAASSSGSPTKTYATVTRNKISAGAAKYTWGIWARNTGSGTLIRDNTVFGGQASGAEANSFAITIEGNLLVDGNRLNFDLGELTPATCAGTTHFCGGVYSISSTSEITNNIILGIDAPRSAGVYLTEEEVPVGTVILNSNYLDGGGSDEDGNLSAAVAMFLGGCCGNNGSVGRIANNILSAGDGDSRYGVWENNASGKTMHPEWLYNNDFFVELDDSPTAYAYYRFWDGAVYSDKTTIDAVNQLSSVLGTVGNNIDADCNVDNTYHLQDGSPCIDAGTAYDAPAFDFDGDARPTGDAHDIGADEAD